MGARPTLGPRATRRRDRGAGATAVPAPAPAQEADAAKTGELVAREQFIKREFVQLKAKMLELADLLAQS